MRTLPLRLAPVQGESLSGYVARYSHTYQFPPGDVIAALGLLGSDQKILSAGRYGISLSPRQLEHVAFATGIPSRCSRGCSWTATPTARSSRQQPRPTCSPTRRRPTRC